MEDEKKQSGRPVPQEQVKTAAHRDPDAPKRTAVDHNPDDPNDLSQQAWDKSYHKEAWNSTAGGRLAIRTFSRGVLGALFFTAGGSWARKMMTKAGGHEYNANAGLVETLEAGNPFHIVTKVIDKMVGKPIEVAVNAMGGNGMRAVHFKPTKHSTVYKGLGGRDIEIHGRTLGEETMFTTFDFFCASVGDAIGRDTVGWFDPAVKKTWMDDKGNFNLPEAAKSMCKSAFRYVTYNGGEDWAVAIPYVFFVRAQRNAIDKHLSPGYRYESDVGLNASSLKMNTKANPHSVNGSYALEAMIDYQSRFTVYNIGTLMYRELYDKVEKAVQGKHVNLYGAPDAPEDKDKSLLGNALDVVKWTARSAIKGVIYMTPAMPFFSLTRVTQGRSRALFVDPSNNSALSFMGTDNKPHFLKASDLASGEHGLTSTTRVRYDRYDPHANGGRGDLVRASTDFDAQFANPTARVLNGKAFDVYERRNNLIENAFSAIGDNTSRMAMGLDRFAGHVDNHPLGTPIKKMLGLKADDKFERFTRNMVNASVSYTPYMYTKAEFAKLWDTGKMDLAAERTIDGIFSGNMYEFKKGLGEIGNAFLHKPFSDPAREKEAQRRIDIDTSASDAFSREESEVSQQQQLQNLKDLKKSLGNGNGKPPESEARKEFEGHSKAFENRMDALQQKYAPSKPAVDLPWQNRVVQGRSEDGEVKAVSTKHAPQSHAEREEMRKMLEAIQPPTNSVH